MLTLILSDLHLGAANGADLLRAPRLRAPLLEIASQAGRVVLLGDVIELRDVDRDEALRAARPFFQELGQALAAGEIVLVAGNHDHALLAAQLASRRGRPGAEPLTLQERIDVGCSPLLQEIAGWCQPARLTVSYPGVWVRADVYAIHGHYLDCHAGLTSGERQLIAAARLRAGMWHGPRSIEDYESLLGALYARLDAHPLLRRLAYSRTLARGGRLLSRLRGEALVQAERTAMAEVAARLGIAEGYVVFGHTHRPGPLGGERQEGWHGRQGVRLINCGCWLASGGLGGAVDRRSTSFTSSCVTVEGASPPQLVTFSGGGLGGV